MSALILTSLVLISAQEERLDHHGSVGLLLGTSGRVQASNDSYSNGWRGTLDLGGTFNVGYGSNELVFAGRFGLGGAQLGTRFGTSTCAGANIPTVACASPDGRLRALDLDFYGGYRGYFGSEHIKTLFDLDVALQLTPLVAAGPRLAFGAEWDFSALIGAYATLGVQLGFGQELGIKAELLLGFHLRSFILE
jgi:hypothetical protein